MQPDISISIINTNNRQMVLDCLGSVFQTKGQLNLEIFVVCNACRDGSQEAIRKNFPDVKIIEHDEMLGFSTNNNLAFNQSTGRYLMLLNDDTIVLPGAFQEMVAFADDHPEAGVVGACLVGPDQAPQKSYDFSPNPFYDGLQPISELLIPLPGAHGKPLEVENVGGACMLVRASAAKKIGYLDTRFDPLYSEEVDWCFRFRKAGWKIFHLPQARVIHLGGATMSRIPVKRYERIFEKKALFFRKHYGKGVVAVYKVCLLLMNIIKSFAWTVMWALGRKSAGDEMKIHWHMVRRALFL